MHLRSSLPLTFTDFPQPAPPEEFIVLNTDGEGDEKAEMEFLMAEPVRPQTAPHVRTLPLAHSGPGQRETTCGRRRRGRGVSHDETSGVFRGVTLEATFPLLPIQSSTETNKCQNEKRAAPVFATTPLRRLAQFGRSARTPADPRVRDETLRHPRPSADGRTTDDAATGDGRRAGTEERTRAEGAGWLRSLSE